MNRSDARIVASCTRNAMCTVSDLIDDTSNRFMFPKEQMASVATFARKNNASWIICRKTHRTMHRSCTLWGKRRFETRSCKTSRMAISVLFSYPRDCTLAMSQTSGIEAHLTLFQTRSLNRTRLRPIVEASKWRTTFCVGILPEHPWAPNLHVPETSRAGYT